MLLLVEDKLKGLKYNIDFGGRGEVQRGRDRDVYYVKRVPFKGSASTPLSVIVVTLIDIFCIPAKIFTILPSKLL